jgi:toxin ParE1/3/4
MTTYTLSPEALDDMTEIAAYIAANNPDAALAQILRFESLFNLLVLQPKAGRLHNELSPSLRGLVEGRYIIFYRETATGVEIARVLHGARDIAREFRPSH